MSLPRLSAAVAVVVVVAASAVALTAAGEPAPEPAFLAQRLDRDCPDFPTQAAAQAALLPGDPERLDRDGDGIACEEEFEAPEPRTFEPVPADAVEDPDEPAK